MILLFLLQKGQPAPTGGTQNKEEESEIAEQEGQPASTGGTQNKKEESEIAVHIQNTEWRLLVEMCKEFIRKFKVTHYATTLELGVTEYQMKEITTEVNQESASGSFSLYQDIEASASVSSAWKKFTEDTHTVTRGVFKNDEVERLAVLDVSVLLITDRVKTPYLRMALQQALGEYFDTYYQDVDHQFESKHIVE